jgi:hypothetical protein
MALFLVSDDAAGVQLDGGEDAVDGRAGRDGDGAADVTLATPAALPVSTSNLVALSMLSMLTNSPVTSPVPVMSWQPELRLVIRVLGNILFSGSVFGFQCSVNPSLTSLSSVQ